MSNKIFVDAVHPEETRVVVVDDTSNKIVDFDIETTTKPQIKGNIYLAKVMRIEPSLQAAFVNYGVDRNGFLPFSEIRPDYYNIDQLKKDKIMELAHANIEDDDDDPDEDADVVEYDDIDSGEDNKEFTKKYREYKIQDVIKPNQILLVQGVKEERGLKGAMLTTYLSLAGRFAALMPNSKKRNSYGISKKIIDKEKRAELRNILHTLEIPKGMTLILRTASTNATKKDIINDYNYLISVWNEIREKTLQSTAPTLIHKEETLLRRVVRDFITNKNDVLTIDGNEAYNEAKSYFSKMHTKIAKNQLIEHKRQDISLFVKEGFEKQLEELHNPYIYLPSGGSIVINQTEAMVTIDVNSSKAIKEKDIELTALNTNLEAAEEIAIQLRLRDLAGIVAIDFIDMEDEKHNKKLEHKMRDVLQHDRARIQVSNINCFGVLMISRQRLRSTFIESSYLTCPHCNGTGIVPSIQTASILMFRRLQEKLLAKQAQKIIMSVPSDVAVYILNNKRFELNQMEKEYNTEIVILADDNLLNIDNYTIQRVVKEETNNNILLNGNSASLNKRIKNNSKIQKTIIDSPKRKYKENKKQSFWKRFCS